MKFSAIRNLVGLVAISGIALAKSEVLNCEKLKSIDDYSVRDCTENENGRILGLAIRIYDGINEKAVKDIFSLKYLRTLTVEAPYQENVQLSLENMTYLKELDITIDSVEEFGYRDYREYIIERGKFAKNGLKLPQSIKKLAFEGIELTQDVIDEVATLPKLNELELRYSTTKNLNFDSFTKSKKLTTLIIAEKNADGYDGYLADNVVNHFTAVKNLKFYNVELNNNIINDISKLSLLENLELINTRQDNLDYSPLKNLTKLTALSIYSPYTYGDYGDEGGVRVLNEYDESILKSLSQLKRLNLEDIKMSSRFVKSINTLSNLRELTIIPSLSYYEKDKEIEIFDITSFNNLQKLTSIVIDGMHIYYNERYKYVYYNGKFDLSKFKKLRKIYVNKGISQKHIKQIASLKYVEEVYLRGMDTELNIDALKSLSTLKVLEVNDEKIISKV